MLLQILLSTPRKIHRLPEQKYTSDAGKQAANRETLPSDIRPGSDYPPAYPSQYGVGGCRLQ
jgi:hypothetical protein